MSRIEYLGFGVNHTADNYVKPLSSCESDADALADMLKSTYGLPVTPAFKSGQCLTDIFFARMKSLSTELKKGDTLILFFSGHGGQIKDTNNEPDEEYDETLCFYDRMLIDDEIHEAFKRFDKGIRILFFSDSCHSGTVHRELNKTIPPNVKYFNEAQNLVDSHPEIYKNSKSKNHEKLKASFAFISACKDDEFALTGSPMSIFTEGLIKEIEANPGITISALYKTLAKNPTLAYNEMTPSCHLENWDDVPLSVILRTDIQEDLGEQTGEVDMIVGFKEKSDLDKALNILLDLNLNHEEVETIDERTIVLQFDQSRAWSYEDIKESIDTIENQFEQKGLDVFVEPDYVLDIPEDQRKGSKEFDPNVFLSAWPAPQNDYFDWYKKNKYSQLESALASVQFTIPSDEQIIRIGHIDTGCWEDHPASPRHLRVDLGRNFIKKEDESDPRVVPGAGANALHGVATGAILAGKKVNIKDGKYAGYRREMGAIPFAEIIPIRISNNVALFGGKIRSFIQAIEYAIEIGCEVISISMGGAPSRRMARVINRAYEKGVVVVAAAGNNFNVIADIVIPEELVYPARFDRVIAVCGVTANQRAYNFRDVKKKLFDDGNRMQGNSGPASAMKYAISAFTPNMPWATMSKKEENYKYGFSVRGGGTSCATPQVAAAAALYIVKNRKALNQFDGTWKKTEIVRQALFNTAMHDDATNKIHRYFGNGILKASNALEWPASDNGLKKVNADTVGWTIIDEYLKLYF